MLPITHYGSEGVNTILSRQYGGEGNEG